MISFTVKNEDNKWVKKVQKMQFSSIGSKQLEKFMLSELISTSKTNYEGHLKSTNTVTIQI